MPKLRTLKPRLQAAPTRQMATASADSWRSGKTTNERGYTYRWQKARERYLAKHPLCVHCQRKGRVTEATDVDHVIPHRGDEALFWNEGNWQSLCHPCHSAKTQQESAQGL